MHEVVDHPTSRHNIGLGLLGKIIGLSNDGILLLDNPKDAFNDVTNL